MRFLASKMPVGGLGGGMLKFLFDRYMKQFKQQWPRALTLAMPLCEPLQRGGTGRDSD